MSAKGIRAGRAFVEIGADIGSTFNKAIAQAKKQMTSLGKQATSIGKSALSAGTRIAAMGAAGGGGLLAITKSFADAGSAVDDMAQRTSMSAEEVSALAYAAQMSGTSIEVVEGAIRKMQKSGEVSANATGRSLIDIASAIDAIPDPAERAATAMKVFGRTNASIPELMQQGEKSVQAMIQRANEMNLVKNPASNVMQAFLNIAAKLEAIPDPAERAATAMKLLGKSGASLLPMLSGGAAGLQNMMKEANDLGLVMSGEDVTAAAELGDTFDRLWSVTRALSNAIGAALAPTVKRIAETMITWGSVVVQFIRDHQGLIVTLAQGLAVVAAVGTAIAAFGGVMMAVGAMIAGTVAAFTAIGTILGALFSPIGLVIAAVVGMGVALLYYTGAGSQALQFMADKWKQFSEWIAPVIDGVKTSLLNGDWGTAGKIAMLALEIALRTGTARMYAIWTDLSTFIQNTWTDIGTTLANAWTGFPGNVITAFDTMGVTLQNVWGSAITNLQNAFSTMNTWLRGMWDGTVNYIAKKLLYVYSLIDRSVDYEQAAKMMDKEYESRAKQRQTELNQTIAQRQAAMDKAASDRLSGAATRAQERDAKTRAVRDERTAAAQAVKDARNAAAEERKAQFTGRIDEAQREMDGLIAKSKEVAATAAAAKGTGSKETQALVLAGLGAKGQMSTAGTISGFAAGYIGGGTSPLQKLSQTNLKQLEVMQKIEENTADNGDDLEFGA